MHYESIFIFENVKNLQLRSILPEYWINWEAYLVPYFKRLNKIGIISMVVSQIDWTSLRDRVCEIILYIISSFMQVQNA